MTTSHGATDSLPPEPSPRSLAGRSVHEASRLAQDLIRLDTTNTPVRSSDERTGNETVAAELLFDYLSAAGVECELVARVPHRANLVARIPGSGGGPSLALLGHTDVVPADPRPWTHPPFGGVVDDQGFLYGRGAIDMKGELAARAVAVAALARGGFRPQGDLWLLAVADEEDGTADVGMRWLLDARPEIRPDMAVNEGGGELLQLADGRSMLTVSVGEKGTFPATLTALGRAGHASRPNSGDNAVHQLARLLLRLGIGMPSVAPTPWLDNALHSVLETVPKDRASALKKAAALHPNLGTALPPMAGTTMAPTMLHGSTVRNVIPDRASADLDCRVLPGTRAADVEAAIRVRLGDDIGFELTWPEAFVAGSSSPATSDLMRAITTFALQQDGNPSLLPLLDSGFTDSVHLREVAGTVAYGFNPYLHTPSRVLTTTVHGVDERVHIDDLGLSVEFHTFLAQELLT
jgi:acetylornithine deacetylase/succinyl-diaminopimelate desuccinylase-like protein